MNELENTNNQLWLNTQTDQHRPASPDYNTEDCVVLNSDDFQPTSQLYSSSLYDEQAHRRTFRHQNPHKFVIVVGSYEKAITLGRGGANTIKIGRRNRNISRTHISIDYNKTKQQFELTVIGLNGACVDDVAYEQHAVVRLENHSIIDVLGDQIQFREPIAPLPLPTAKEQQHQQANIGNERMNINTVAAVAKELSPEPEQQTAAVGEEEQVKENKEIKLADEKPAEESEKIVEEPATHQNEVIATHPDESINSAPKSEKMNQEVVHLVKETTELIELPSNDDETTEQTEKKSDRKEEETVKAIKEEPSPEMKKGKKAKDAKNAENNAILKDSNNPAHGEEKKEDYSEVIIDALVFSRTSSMPISDICSRILKAHPVYAEHSREVWIERIRKVLKEKPFFGEIQRKGKAADGTPVENLYYYNSELDPVEWRRATYTQVGRSARKCTLKDKQYFWKIPPKLGRHRSSYVPPPANNNGSTAESASLSTAATKRQRSPTSIDENNEPKKIKQ
ncbi:hypothetical protein BDF20DRAFT_877111 [Mycotypha africana]|uniref:uncharacterized protein n=1 Tax=Mycotypha africana TaxID=64632 RepID=UPI002301AC4C|nr:uncharacterized protein BDF20DRAFT_877111 [Mycotypha africana]KAI8975153.1 hypothetical protein BDF20DRAFT_877111 [Mycotypha africana]